MLRFRVISEIDGKISTNFAYIQEKIYFCKAFSAFSVKKLGLNALQPLKTNEITLNAKHLTALNTKFSTLNES